MKKGKKNTLGYDECEKMESLNFTLGKAGVLTCRRKTHAEYAAMPENRGTGEKPKGGPEIFPYADLLGQKTYLELC